MKKCLLVLFLSLSLFGANVDKFAKEMNFQRDYKTALVKAKLVHKPLIMVLGADYCPWCRKFEQKTLKSSLIKPRLDKEFVVLIVDKKFDIDTFPAQYRTKATPRVFFIDSKNEEILFDTLGYIKKKKFAKSLDRADKLYKASK